MKNDAEIEAKIMEKGLVAPRITKEQIDSLMKRVTVRFSVEGTSTFCHGFLDGKFYLGTGHSACVSPENFNALIGQDIALQNMQATVRTKLWELEGYCLYKDLNK